MISANFQSVGSVSNSKLLLNIRNSERAIMLRVWEHLLHGMKVAGNFHSWERKFPVGTFGFRVRVKIWVWARVGFRFLLLLLSCATFSSLVFDKFSVDFGSFQ